MKEQLIKIIKDRYITAHCNPDFTGDKFKFIFAPIEQPIEPISRERVIAYEFQCIETGHCYVDYIKREDLEEKGSKYKQIPLYYASELCPDAGEKEPVNNDKAIIQKQDELIKHLKSYDWLCELDQLKEWLSKKHQIEQELQALKAE